MGDPAHRETNPNLFFMSSNINYASTDSQTFDASLKYGVFLSFFYSSQFVTSFRSVYVARNLKRKRSYWWLRKVTIHLNTALRELSVPSRSEFC